MKAHSLETMGESIEEFAREIASLVRVTERVSARMEAGAMTPSEIVGVIAWWANANHIFRRQKKALERLGASLTTAAGVEL